MYIHARAHTQLHNFTLRVLKIGQDYSHYINDKHDIVFKNCLEVKAIRVSSFLWKVILNLWHSCDLAHW